MLYTVDLALTECLNIIWKHTKLLRDLPDPNIALEDLQKIFEHINVISTQTIAEEIINIAITKNITVYDATYIAAAQKLNSTLYTADQKLCTLAKTTINTKLLQP